MTSGQWSVERPLITHHWSLAASAAFTLIELLVVIGIIAILIGLVLVGITRVGAAGGKLRVSADLQSISTALEAYKQDFGDYPRVDNINTGAAVLCKALIGPSPKPETSGSRDRGQFFQTGSSPNERLYVSLIDANTTAPPTSPVVTSNWAEFNPFDGADGVTSDFGELGYRVGAKTIDVNGDGTPDRPGGPVRPPYLAAEKFIKRKASGFLVDGNGNPILYFPANVSAKVSAAGGYVSGNAAASRYNAEHNIRFFMRSDPPGSTTLEATPDTRGLKRVRAMFGDFGMDGGLNAQTSMSLEENGADKVPFVLYTAGPDGVFGPVAPGAADPLEFTPTTAGHWDRNSKAVQSCDDIASFR